MLGSEIKACKPLQNDLKSGQRHRHDLSVWRSILGCPSKTKKWGQTPDPKCRKVNLYGEMGCTKLGGIISPRCRGRFGTGVGSPNASASKLFGERGFIENGRGGGGELIGKLGSRGPFFADFRRFSAVWALLLKNQSAITPSILGVRGSSSDSRNLSPIPFDNMPNQA